MVNNLLYLAGAAARIVGAGALLAFGWIFGEHGAAKVIERMETRGKSVKTKNGSAKS